MSATHRSDREGDPQRTGEFNDLTSRQRANVVGQRRFRQADQFIAMDRALVLQTFVDADGNLRRQAVVDRVHRGTNHGREFRVDEDLTADNDEHARPLSDREQTDGGLDRGRRASRDGLVGEDVLGLFVEALGASIDDIQVLPVPR